MSGPISVGDHYAVVMLVKRIAGDGITLEKRGHRLNARFAPSRSER